MKINRYITAIVCIGLFIGCQDIDKPKKPDNLLSESKLEEILFEYTLLSSAKGYNAEKMSQTGINPETYILEKFDIDSTTLAQNIAYVAAKTEEFKEMNTRISKRYQKLYVVADSLHLLSRKTRDSSSKNFEKERVEFNTDTLKPIFRNLKEINTKAFGNSRKLKGTKDSLSRE